MRQRDAEFGFEDRAGPEAGYVHIFAQKKVRADDIGVFNWGVANSLSLVLLEGPWLETSQGFSIFAALESLEEL